MTTYTITVEPTVAPSTISETLQSSASTIDAGGKNEDADVAFFQGAKNFSNATTRVDVGGNAVTVSSTTYAYGATVSQSSYPSYQYDSVAQTGETVDAFEVVVIETGGNGFGKTTLSWDGQRTIEGDDTTISTNATASFSREFETTTNVTAATEISISTTTSAQIFTYATNETGISRTTTSRQETTETPHTTVTSSVATTTSSEEIIAYNATTGTRGTATVVLLGKNEALWIPTAFGIGNALSEFASYVTEPEVTVTRAIITAPSVTGELSASALYDTTKIESTTVGTSTKQTTLTITPVGATKIPDTQTTVVSTMGTSSTALLIKTETANSDTPTVSRKTQQTATMPAQFGSTTWQSTFYQTANSFTTNSALLVGSVSGSASGTIDGGLTDDGWFETSLGSGSTTTKTGVSATFSETFEAQLVQLPINCGFVTASSFYQARAALPSLTDVARDAYVQGITFKASAECLAAQTAAAQFPTSWTYTSEGSSVTVSADAGGVTQTQDSGGESRTTTSGQWRTAGGAHLTQTSATRLNPVLNAPTGSASLFELPGTVFVTGSASSWTEEKIGTAVLSELPNERQAVSYAPIWAVGSGEYFLTSQRNDSEFPDTAALL